jgi:Dolichyl-phosphate-mannose-protein mannosyltransferase
MWNDELFTFYISRLPSVSDIWSVLSTGADQSPLFFHMITRASSFLFGVNHLSIRLPEALGFLVMSLCLFQFVSKRSAAVYGFVAMLFPLVTKAHSYAYEARPYGLLLGFCGLSLVCWQSASEGRYRTLSLIGLAVSFAAAVSSHYYAILLFFPLALGELARSLSRRRLDLPIWIAFGAPIIPLLLSLPLIEAGRTYADDFWAKPNWGSISKFYDFLLRPALLAMVAMLISSVLYSMTPPIRLNGRNEESPPFHEIVAAFGCVAMPVVGVILGIFITGAFAPRYALPSVMGFSILFAFAAYRLFDGRALLAVALALFLCGGFIMRMVRNLEETTEASLNHVEIYRFLRSERESRLPIVVANAHPFMELT